MSELIATANKTDVTLSFNGKKVVIPVSQLSYPKINAAFEELGVEESFPSAKNDAVKFAVDQTGSKIKPTLVALERSHGQVTLKTMNPRAEATVIDPLSPLAWDKVLNSLNISVDDYAEFCQWLEKNGLPDPSNASKITTQELTVENLNEFGFEPTEATSVDPTLFIDEKLTIDDLFEFKLDTDAPIFTIDDETRKSIQELFEFSPKPKSKKS